MRIVYLPTAEKQLKRLPKNQKVKVLKTIRKITLDPAIGKELQGRFVGLRSARAWPYRILYRFLKGRKLVIIETVQHRQQAYK